jgi:murein L,D-transpeptidase YcbB/YkuD
MYFTIIGGMKSNFSTDRLMKTIFWAFLTLLVCFSVYSCKEKEKPSEKDIVKKPELFPDRLKKNLQEIIDYAYNNSGRVNDTTFLKSVSFVKNIYETNGYNPLWSSEGSWVTVGDSLNDFINNCKEYGLFPSDYNYRALTGIQRQVKTDTLSQKDAALWSRADVLLTDALFRIAEHLKRGRLPYDSISRKDTAVISDSFYVDVLNNIVSTKQVKTHLNGLEPKLSGYQDLKSVAKSFIDSVKFREYTYLPFPFTDTSSFYSLLANRLMEEGLLDSLPAALDSTTLRKTIVKYQASKKYLKTTGKVNENTVKSLNDTNWERFKRLALSLDKYKLMPDSLPTTYVWVNIPSYNLKVMDSGLVALESKVIVGADKTRTPELTSSISNFITYPQWTVPYSIVFKEMLPAIQKDINYLKKQNLMVVDRYDSVLDPAKINWSKLSKKKFPYLIKQREGDDNSLGVMKFNFANKYAVYLHDTNARWMFSKTSRALSHGCVRVQDWRDLAHFLVRNDSVKYSVDTLASWIVRQEKHVVSGFKRVPLFIRYFSCEAKDGRIKFYDDVYGEDKILAEKYFVKNIY